MDTARLSELARSLTRDEFSARVNALYLAVGGEDAEDVEIAFQTSVVPANSRRTSPPAARFDLRELTKRASNPYADRISIGRARNCDIVLRDRSVSKLHAHFRLRPEGGLDLVDLGSQNGTRINDRPLVANNPEPVEPGARILIGSVLTILLDPPRLFDLLR
jgi:FHA domain-containing protein